MTTRTHTTLLTGCTGLIGQYVLSGLLRRDHRVVVLMRGPVEGSRIRLREIMAPHGVDTESAAAAGRLVIASGNLPGELPAPTWGATSEILHVAGCLQLDGDVSGEPFATNVAGSQALSAWADSHGVSVFHSVSTAYVCGRDVDCARESVHTRQPRFCSDYELSKWQAEAYLHEWARRRGKVLTTLRPGLVVGDSETGFTSQYGGFYQLAHVLDILRQYFQQDQQGGTVQLPLRLQGSPDAPQNLVPVDYVSAAIVHIVCNRACHGRIYHLTNPAPPTNAQVKSWFESYMDISGGCFCDQVESAVHVPLAQSMFQRTHNVILDHFRFVPHFDCSNTLEALRDSEIRCPQLNHEHVTRMLDYASRKRWGRRAVRSAS